MEAVDGAAVCGCWANRQAKPDKLATSSRARRGSTIPYWLVIVIGLVTIIGSILAAELWLARHGYADASDALAACLYFFLDAISAFAVTGTVTEVSVRLRMCLVDVRNVYLLRTCYGPPRLCRPPKGLAAARSRVCRGRARLPTGGSNTILPFCRSCFPTGVQARGGPAAPQLPVPVPACAAQPSDCQLRPAGGGQPRMHGSRVGRAD